MRRGDPLVEVGAALEHGHRRAGERADDEAPGVARHRPLGKAGQFGVGDGDGVGDGVGQAAEPGAEHQRQAEFVPTHPIAERGADDLRGRRHRCAYRRSKA
jgi:hypothetical protein